MFYKSNDWGFLMRIKGLRNDMVSFYVDIDMIQVIKQDASDVFQIVNGMNKYWLALNCSKQLISNELCSLSKN